MNALNRQRDLARRPLTILLWCLSLCLSLSLQAAEQAGEVARASGSAEIRSAGGEIREAKKKLPVFVGDTIKTGSNGQVMMRMEDRSTMLVRPNSEVVIEAFQYERRPDDVASTDVLAGAIRSVTGKIGQSNPENVRFSAGTATVGIRGTDIELAILAQDGEDRAGVYNYVYEGETEMRLASGESAAVTKGLTGFTPSNPEPGEPLLQVLRDRPAFLQSSGFDTLIQQLSTPRVPMIR